MRPRFYKNKPQKKIDIDIVNNFNLIDRIDFGEIDGLYDKNLSSYFLDDDYWTKLIDGRKFFVIGRKGTGKSAIYNWVFEQQYTNNVIVSNLSFKNFPFEKLLRLTDDDFSRPNQYQSVWRNIILSEICKHIMIDSNSIKNESYLEIKKYFDHKFGTDLTDLHKRVTKQTTKTKSGLFFQGTGIGTEVIKESELSDEFDNLTLINSKLEFLIKEYLKISPSVPYIIQFDQLDDNYTIYVNNDEYFQSIISLFKVVYDLNQSFYQINIPIKIICYLRSDIFYEINNYDAESARWDQHKHYLNWAIINRSDWHDPKLLQLLNKRIIKSLPDIPKQNPLAYVMKGISLVNNEKKTSVFAYMVKRSFQRPRDLVQFCIKIQEDSRKWKKLNTQNVLDGEKEYSSWLLGEVANEFGPFIKDKNTLYDFLRNLGERNISYDDFHNEYKPFEKEIGMKTDNLLKLLYRLGIIFNVNQTKNKKEYFAIIRNEKSSFNKNLKIQLHPGFNKGLHVYSS